MATVRLDGDAITDWNTFHDLCADEFGFPDFYGRNMNAWIDCLSYITKGDGMSRIVLNAGELLTIEIEHSDSLRRRLPEIYNAIAECTQHVNSRFVESGDQPRIQLAML
jgi:RNAse (barnase) inhibitor barstar